MQNITLEKHLTFMIFFYILNFDNHWISIAKAN